MEIYNNLKKISEDITKFKNQTTNNNLIEILLTHIKTTDEIKKIILEDSNLFNKILDRYKNITTIYLDNSETLENLLLFVQKKLINDTDITNQMKSKYIKFDKIIYNYLDTTNFFQLCFNETEQDNIIITKEDVEDYKLNNPNKIIENDDFIWRNNQLEAINRLKTNGFETGIHCQATGTGKSLIILKYIDLMYKKNSKCKIILFTERVSILSDLFDFNNKEEKNNTNYDFWKKHDICNFDNFNIINRVTTKKNDWIELLNNSKKATLLVINRAYLTLSTNYKNIKDLSLILHDECHNVPSNKCFDFLKYIKINKIPIIGFSATPLRTGNIKKEGINISNMSRLLEIYGLNNKLNLLTNYNMIYAISNNPPLILSPRFYWFDIEITNKKKEENHLSVSEIGSALQVLEDVIKTLHYKKLVAWCGTIPLCKEWFEKIQKFKEEFKNLYPNLYKMNMYMDLSIKNNSKILGYNDFKKLENNGIMLCAQKHREGSDIKNLDGCIFLDKVKNRGSIPFIQSIGRVLRLDPNNKKNCGVVIDGVIRDNDDYEKNMVDKILGYYFALNDITNIKDIDKDNYKQYITLRDVVEFDKDNKIIKLNFNKTNITINCKKLDWKNIISQFEILLEKKINLTTDEKLKIEFEKLKNIVKNKNLKNMSQYFNYASKHDLIKNPDEIYKNYWSNYCDFLNIDTSNYIKTKEKLKQFCFKKNVSSITDYCELFKNNDNIIPENPCDYFKVKNFDYFINNYQEKIFI